MLQPSKTYKIQASYVSHHTLPECPELFSGVVNSDDATVLDNPTRIFPGEASTVPSTVSPAEWYAHWIFDGFPTR